MAEQRLAQHASSPDETRALLIRARAGDSEAKDELVRNNMRLVAAVVHRFQWSGIDFDDLFQVGCIGLVKAIDGFDLSYDVRFSTYAVPVIMGEIRQYVRRQHPVRLGAKLETLMRDVAVCREQLTVQFAREPTVGEIASELGVDSEDVAAALAARQPVASLDEPVYQKDGEAVPMGQRLAADDEYERFVENVALKAALAQLPDWERRLVVLRFFEEKSQTETAQLLGVSQAHISRAERRILRQFRESFA